MSFPNEKTASYLPVSNQGPVHKVSKSKKVIGSLLAAASIAWAGNLYVSRLTGAGFVDRWTSPAPLLENQCPQVDALTPKFTTPALELIIPTIESPTYKKSSVAILSNAVKIPTVSRDDMGHPGEDERWEIFYEFYDYLKKTFPLIHKHLDIDKVNTHGLVYTWKGTNPSLKPTLLLAHQDVVPVPETTIPTWTHPPFGGVFDGTFVWGRGSSDCKNQLLGIMESVELLLTAKFIPTRTILLSFGFDEECGGTEGAGSLATYLVGKYGKDSMAVIVDEGMKMQKLWGALVAQPGVAEKGAMDVHVTVRTPGGHSSVPPPHTSIGVLSELIQLIEAATYPTYLDEKNPYYGTIQCGAEYAPEFPDNLRKILSHKKRTSGAKSCMKKDLLAEEAAKESLFHKYLMTTSVAVDVVCPFPLSSPSRTTQTNNPQDLRRHQIQRPPRRGNRHRKPPRQHRRLDPPREIQTRHHRRPGSPKAQPHRARLRRHHCALFHHALCPRHPRACACDSHIPRCSQPMGYPVRYHASAVWRGCHHGSGTDDGEY